MRAFTLLLAVALVACVSANVLTLTDATFDQKIKHDKPAVILYYASWCGYSKKFLPVFKEAAAQYKGPAIFAQVEAEQNTAVRDRANVDGYPTILVYKKGATTGVEIDRSSDPASFLANVAAQLGK